MRLKDVPIWGTVFEGRLFPITRKSTASALPSSGSPGTGLAAYRLPSLFAPSEGDHEHSDDCGACSFSRLLARSRVLDTLAVAPNPQIR